MKIVVLGGLGSQGRAVLIDLARSPAVDEVICADANLAGWAQFAKTVDTKKITPVKMDASSPEALCHLFKQGVDVAIDLLPVSFMSNAFEAAIASGVPLVSTNYAHSLRHLHQQALDAGVTLVPECGLDPGIDLVLFGHGVRQFDEVKVLNSYCGGFPEKSACNNPLNYKVTWNWEMVLRSSMRNSLFIKDGQRLAIPAADQHKAENVGTILFPGLGELECIPNGDAAVYADLLGIAATIEETTRYALRWPGWSNFWRPLKQLGFLSDEALDFPCGQVSPLQFLTTLIGPQVQYEKTEKDIVVMQNVFEGIKDGKRKSLVSNLLIERDLESGLFAMNMGVGYPVSVVAQMIAKGEITKKGLLSPALDIPCETFFSELSKRGIKIDTEMKDLD
ncbi:saccharopine dehydrogenase family protein [Geopsychrobacter electrodiphilus]|uniref:saccharopine dehydrogenase family protein n=1 Tax=Geopsychrobacter electrodiphilus TaxID=225196 RepID=UPI000377C34A|nr:saccharopine dehydrogenase C-terminal domain-containing protein [Geopsychrobacter electrodiphilus]